MTDAQERAAKALEAVRDVTKQLVTIDAALLTFGIAFVQNISKSQGPTGWIDIATIALLCSLFVGILALYQVAAETHSTSGTINALWVRWPLIISMGAFVVAAFCIAWYVIEAPKPLPT